MSPLVSFCRRAALPLIALTIAGAAAHAQDPQPDIAPAPFEVSRTEAIADTVRIEAVPVAELEPAYRDEFVPVEPTPVAQPALVAEPAYSDEFVPAEPEPPLKITPALVEARLELKARVDAWVCHEISPELKKFRAEFDAMLLPEDRLMIDTIRVLFRPLLKDAFTSINGAREARELGDREAARRYEERLEEIGSLLEPIFEPFEKRFKQYKKPMKAIERKFEKSMQEWQKGYAAVAEEWQRSTTGALDERQISYALRTHKKEWSGQMLVMVFLLPIWEDCDFEEPTMSLPSAGGAALE